MFEKAMPSQKNVNLLASVISIILIVTAVLMEHFLGLKSCSICIIQRIIFGILALLFLSSFLLFKFNKIYLYLQYLAGTFAVLGVFLAIRQSYYQLYPDPFATCGIPFEYIMDNYPVIDIAKQIFNGTGDCQEIQWTFLGLTLPMWTIFCFLFFLIINIYLIKKRA